MTKMKGSSNRVMLLRSLGQPKDRLQLARNLSLDWKTVDHHVRVLLENNLIQESIAYGNVRIYQLTTAGRSVLKVLDGSIASNSRLVNLSTEDISARIIVTHSQGSNPPKS